MAADEKNKTEGTQASADQPEKAAQAGADAAPADDGTDKKPARSRRIRTEEPAAEDVTSTAEAGEESKGKTPAKPRARKPAKAEPAAEEPATEVETADAQPVAEAETAAEEQPAAERKPAAEAEPAAEGQPAAEAAPEPAKKPARSRRKAAEPGVEKTKARTARKPAAKSGPQPGPLEGVVVDADGNRLETVALREDRFGVAADVGMLHLVVRAEQAARRSGTASTKTRGEISGTTGKMYRQKGTGRARAGSVKSPIRTGGGTVFGPKPRDYSMKVNRKVVRKALAMALSNRAESGSVFVTRGLDLERPSTRAVNQMLVAMDIPAPVLVVTSDEPVVARSIRNLSYAEVADVAELSTEKVLRARSLVFTEKAFSSVNEAVSS